MDSKVLYPIAVVIAALSGGYYYYSGKGQKLDVDASRNMTYSAEKLQITQTDEQGQLYIRAQVNALEQDMQKKTSRLEVVNAQMYKDGEVDATFQAQLAQGYDDNQKVVLSNQVIARKLMPQGEMTFTTPTLTVYPKTKTLQTDQAIQVESPQAVFVSQGLQADLNSGQYVVQRKNGFVMPKGGEDGITRNIGCQHHAAHAGHGQRLCGIYAVQRAVGHGRENGRCIQRAAQLGQVIQVGCSTQHLRMCALMRMGLAHHTGGSDWDNGRAHACTSTEISSKVTPDLPWLSSQKRCIKLASTCLR